MATFITKDYTWNGKENLDYFLKPMFIGKQPWETQGVRVMPNVKSSQRLNYFGAAAKILKAYQKGFNAAAGTTLTQRVITTHRMKAEAADDANDFYETVFEEATRVDDWNNLDGTMLKEIIATIYRNAVASDVFRQFWLNDEDKETLDGTTNLPNGVADEDYNAYDGMWKLLMGDAAENPNESQIKRIAFSNGAVAQECEVTFTGSSGTANLTIGGITYLVTWDTDLTTTLANWLTSTYGTTTIVAHLASRGITATSAAAVLTLLSSIPGQPFAVPTVANASGNLAGTNNTTQANVAPADLTAGQSEDMFLALYNGADKVLKQIPKAGKVFLVSDSVYENYETYLESLGTERAHIKLENGYEGLSYRGIPVINVGWDIHLEADFAHVEGENPAYLHRVIYTDVNNLVLGIDSMNQFNGTRMWYNEDEEENRFRSKLVMGVQYVHNKLTALGY